MYVAVIAAPTIAVGPSVVGSTPPNLAAWDGGLAGSVNTGIFDGVSGTLVPGDFLEVEFSIEVDPNAAGPGGSLQNQVEATANDPFGTPISDLSDDGTISQHHQSGLAR